MRFGFILGYTIYEYLHNRGQLYSSHALMNISQIIYYRHLMQVDGNSGKMYFYCLMGHGILQI